MSGSRTEDSILGNIPDFAGESDSGTTTDTPATTSAPATQPSTQDQGGGTTSAPPTQQTSEGSGTQQPTQQAFRRRHDGLLEQPNADNPRVRDLVDPVTGRVVAKGGIERHVFEDSQRNQRENVQLKGQLQQLQGFVNSVGETTREAARLNIKPEDHMIALRVMSDFLRDPVRTLETLVAEVKSKGYPIPFLEQGVSPGMDMNAIARMIDQKMAPLTQQQQEGARTQQAKQQAEQQLNDFLGKNPEAHENLDVLGEMLQAQPSLGFHDAYTKMIRWAHENGLDWTQALKPQIAAREAQQPTQQPTNQQPTTRPLPGQRSVGTGAQRVNGTGQSGSAFNENASWADIIRDSMREHGVSIN